MKQEFSDRMLRLENAHEAKRHARAARARQGVTFEAAASALHLGPTHTKRRFLDEERGTQLTYGDLFLLAKNPETAAMVRDMLAPLLELVDTQNLRLSDLENLSRTSTGANLALAYLRPTYERLMPMENLSDTSEAAGE